eukprot:GDKJ01016057.1.p1 GENE.GDKJ01016057.1~~GDKJ01016057.1.p1  ORF type:complete len:480 (-),score=81.69 GDKJ01016057.1:51-1469(-)
MTFKTPTKDIKSETDLENFLNSKSYDDLMVFITNVGDSVKGLIIGPELKISENGCKTLDFLSSIDAFIDACPLIPQPGRFGNKGFQTFFDMVGKKCPSLLSSMLPESMHEAIPELLGYLQDSFGNRSRIDYGTGHEQHFLIFLYCLFRLNFLSVDEKNDLTASALLIFAKYIQIMRRIEIKYTLEPAGSRGVWGLDDYHFLPFLWGAAQLEWQNMIVPKDIFNERTVKDYRSKYLYLDAICIIKELKAGAPFAEVAPILTDISAVPNWRKIYDGLIKMYHGEVHRKYPVMQHLLFGSLFPFNPSEVSESREKRLWNNGPKSMGAKYSVLDDSTSMMVPGARCGIALGGGLGGAGAPAPWARIPGAIVPTVANVSSSTFVQGEDKGIRMTSALTASLKSATTVSVSAGNGVQRGRGTGGVGTSERDETPLAWREWTRRVDLPKELLKEERVKQEEENERKEMEELFKKAGGMF